MINAVNDPKRAEIPSGELTILEDPVVTVKKSKRPADEPEIINAINKKIKV